MSIEEVAWDKKRKFHLIEVVAYWEGRVTNDHLKRAFDIHSRTTGAGLFQTYNSLTHGNLSYSSSLRGYAPSDDFQFQFSKGDLGEYLSLMTQHSTLNPSFSGIKDIPAPTEAVSLPHRAVAPSIVRQVVLATQKGARLELIYRSHSTPEGEDRIIAPHTLVYSGLRWHARAWCEKHRSFRDFVLTRIEPGAEIIGEALPEADPGLDESWNRQIALLLIPNPALTEAQQRMVALDYGMSAEWCLEVRVRAAMVHYLMLSLNIFLDSHRFKPEEQPLVVLNTGDIEPFIFG
ncbi:WYL domain-containing protein [Vreelandella titanicae]|uniref:WYL domain-containing protein n=1 Tax=Vreelandella titanicae TaxID=664683 RepID=UPI0016801317|nr:WYL domain-containing protein [Halomonas titanicae]QNU60657.1 WYL domain-containing protein [Halomonas titanicae]